MQNDALAITRDDQKDNEPVGEKGLVQNESQDVLSAKTEKPPKRRFSKSDARFLFALIGALAALVTVFKTACDVSQIKAQLKPVALSFAVAIRNDPDNNYQTENYQLKKEEISPENGATIINSDFLIVFDEKGAMDKHAENVQLWLRCENYDCEFENSQPQAVNFAVFQKNVEYDGAKWHLVQIPKHSPAKIPLTGLKIVVKAPSLKDPIKIRSRISADFMNTTEDTLILNPPQ